ncbi:hypothetical protein [Arenibaculum sp.]|jgi:hypothetical protein|uniref:hypothetical protein n=1 Tax=Arenibaculum sp. TaxID=2865862 RepID=UPI002E141092|nr:hypothetical protein [Arenibaculum sp.]
MRLLTAFAWIALSTLSVPPTGIAAEGPSDIDFRGVAGVRVTISPMSADATDCRLAADPLLRELEQQLTAKGLKAMPESDVVATITVLSAYEPNAGRCSSAVMLGAYRKASFFDEDAGWLRTGHVVVWQSGLLTSSSPEQHPAGVRDALARLGDAMALDWHRANETP